ncbi:MAG: AsmA-like C-terminal region-containing protein, partial [Bacteroidota bacterium]
VLKDGMANYDIVKESTEEESEEATSTEEESFLINLNSYEIRNGSMVYDDATLPMRMEIEDLTHEGNGDFTMVNYDLRTVSDVKGLTVSYDGITYLNQAHADGTINMNIDTKDNIIIKLRDNLATLNEIVLGAKGEIQLLEDAYDMDIAFSSKETSFKRILSLVPAVYLEGYEDLSAEGTFNLEGYVKGIYNESRLPGFGIDLGIENGLMQYPDLPESISGINLDMNLYNPDGELENTHINIRNLHADLGQNPIQASATISGLERITLSGNLNAKVQLESLSSMLPLEGNELKGLFSVNATANGIYDEANNAFPVVDAHMALTDGYIKSIDYNTELSNINVKADLVEASGDLQTTRLEVPSFHFDLDGSPVDGDLYVSNFDDPTYKLRANGNLDLEKLMNIYPVEGTSLKGKLIVENFETSGTLSDIEAEKYDRLPTSGRAEIQDLLYTSTDMEHAVTISSGEATFTPEQINLSPTSGTIGSSDYQVQGYLSNYLAYALKGEPLKGAVIFQSNKMDLNQWMTEEEVPTTTGSEPVEEVPLEVIPIPDNLDLLVQADIGQLTYSSYNIQNFTGALEIIDEKILMDGVNFDMLGGNFTMGGSYNTQNIKEPAYSFAMKINELQAKEAYNAFNTVQSFAPAAKLINGNFNTDLNLSGLLGSDMMPKISTITAGGFFEILRGSLASLPFMAKISEETKIAELAGFELKDLKGTFSIEDGYVNIKPITLRKGDIAMTIGGRQNIAGELDYQVKLDVPSGEVGEAAFSAISKLAGTDIPANERLVLNFNVGGNAKDPQIMGLQSGLAGSVTDQATEAVKNTLADKLGEETGIQLNTDSTSLTEAVKNQAKDTLKATADKVAEKAKDTLKKAAEEKVTEVIGEEAKSKLEELKKKFPFPKKKKN